MMAKTVYVLYWILANATGVTMTTMNYGNLDGQFLIDGLGGELGLGLI